MDDLFQRLKTRDATQLAQTLSINLEHASPRISQLQNALESRSDSQVSTLVEQQHLNDDWAQFEPLVTSYLLLCKHIDPWSILKSHDLLLSFFSQLCSAFMNTQFGELLCPLVVDTLVYINPMMSRLDLILDSLPGKKHKRLIFVSTVLSKVFNHLRSLKGSPKKKQLILFIVNKLNRVYFTIGSPLLCANIFANVNLLELKFSQYPRAQQVEYRYILGRYYVAKDQLYRAYYHLSWSFKNMLRGSDQNLMKVLRYLIPVSLLIGKLPSRAVLQRFPELDSMYAPLAYHLQKGNHFAFQQHLFEHQSYFQSRGLLILLAQRSRILLFRNLFAQVFSIGDNNRLLYAHLQVALQRSIRSSEEQTRTFGNQFMFQILNETVDLAFVQNVCSSLIENDMIRGNVIASARLVVLSKTNAFPDVYTSYQQKFGVSGSERWMD